MEHFRQPPAAPDMEMACLGAALISATAAEYVASEMGEADLWCIGFHRVIQQAVLTLVTDEREVDGGTVAAHLEAHGHLKAVGGEAYLARLMDACPVAAHIETYAEFVREKATRRRLLLASGSIQATAYDEESPVSECIGTAEAALYRAVQGRRAAEWLSSRQVAHSAHDWLHAEEDNRRGVTTGFDPLDRALGGWKPGRLYVLAGRPGSGKTAVASGFLLEAAAQGTPCGFFSLEMDREDLRCRLLAQLARVDGMRLENRTLNEAELAKVNTANARLGDLPLYLNDDRELTLLGLRGLGRRLTRKEKAGLFVVDYLQLVQPPAGKEMDHRHFTAVAEGLKSMARELNVPVIALSQLSRRSEHRENKRPLLSELRESGGIEQAADVVLLLYREAYHKRQEGEQLDGPDLTEFNIGKNRQGRTGLVKLWYEPEFLTFRETEMRFDV